MILVLWRLKHSRVMTEHILLCSLRYGCQVCEFWKLSTNKMDNFKTYRFERLFQRAYNLERATLLCSCNGVSTDLFIFSSIFPQFWLSNKSYTLVIKNWRIENCISDTLIASTFSFCHYRIMDAHTYGTLLPFWRENVLQNDAKNKLTCGNAVEWTKYGSDLFRIMGSCFSWKTGNMLKSLTLMSPLQPSFKAIAKFAFSFKMDLFLLLLVEL